MKKLSAFVILLAAASCADKEAAPPRAYTQADATVFPADRSLMRPEDGFAHPDGRIIVADQAHGLRAIAPDGTSAPFGGFAEAGYAHAPSVRPAGPNGVTLERDRAHALIADIYTGAIWRVSLADETVTLIHQHEYGANSIERDASGALWFTQSTENAAGPDSEARLFAAIDRPIPDGALFRLAPPAAPVKAIDGLLFANGVAIDDERGVLYVAETMGDRILGFDLDSATGELTNRRVVATVLTPDNLKLDEKGLLWVASPIRNEVLIVDPDSGETRSFFRAATPENDLASAEWSRRAEAAEPRLDLMSPAQWAPLPGLLTSVILTPGDGTVYLVGLGDALLKLER